MSLCKANCGFFSQHHGYCSVCAVIHQESEPTPIVTVVPDLVQTETPVSRSRCTHCSRKVGLLGFDCACTGVFCKKCRHVEAHHCPVDHATIGKALLEKNNPVIMASKLVRMD